MGDESVDQQTPKVLKRPKEENEDSVDKATKRVKAEGEQNEDDRKYPKKKVVLLLAYSGKGYYGMQVLSVLPYIRQRINPGEAMLQKNLICIGNCVWGEYHPNETFTIDILKQATIIQTAAKII